MILRKLFDWILKSCFYGIRFWNLIRLLRNRRFGLDEISLYIELIFEYIIWIDIFSIFYY